MLTACSTTRCTSYELPQTSFSVIKSLFCDQYLRNRVIDSSTAVAYTVNGAAAQLQESLGQVQRSSSLLIVVRLHRATNIVAIVLYL